MQTGLGPWVIMFVDAYDTFAVVSALVFGFSVSACTAMPGVVADAGESNLINAYAVMTSIASALSGLSTCIMVLEVYYLHMINKTDATSQEAVAFLKSTSRLRDFAKASCWIALAALFCATALLMIELLDTGSGAVAATPLSAAAFFVLVIPLYFYTVALPFEKEGRTTTIRFLEAAQRMPAAALGALQGGDNTGEGGREPADQPAAVTSTG